MKNAEVLRFDNKEVIYPSSKTTAGVYLASEPYLFLDWNSSSYEDYVAIKKAFNAYREGIPHPTDWKNQQKEYLSYLGFKSMKDLFKKASMCSLELKDNILTITPYLNKGMQGGFIPFSSGSINISFDSTPDQIARALNEAFLKVKS